MKYTTEYLIITKPQVDMEKYKNQLKNFKFNYKIRTKRGQKIKKNLDIITFDIEVTSAWKLGDGTLTAYEAGHSAEERHQDLQEQQ